MVLAISESFSTCSAGVRRGVTSRRPDAARVAVSGARERGNDRVEGAESAGSVVPGEVDEPPTAVEVLEDRGVLVAEVRGDVDVDTFRDVREALFTCLNQGAPALVVDLCGVGFFGTMGIAVLVEARQRADVLGTGFAVVAGRRAVARPIRVADLEDVLGLHRTRDEALAAVRGPTDRDGADGPADTGFSWWSS